MSWQQIQNETQSQLGTEIASRPEQPIEAADWWQDLSPRQPPGVWVEGIRTNQPAPPADVWDEGEWAPRPAAPRSIAATAEAAEGGEATAIIANAAVGGIETLRDAAQSPAGSIGAFLPAGGGGGGTDYAGQAISRALRQAMLAALKSKAGIPSRFGG